MATDTNQLLYYHYIKGSASLCEGETPDERRLREFDELYTTWKLASRKGFLYFEGNGIQGLANLMASPDNYDFYQGRRTHALKQLRRAGGFFTAYAVGTTGFGEIPAV